MFDGHQIEQVMIFGFIKIGNISRWEKVWGKLKSRDNISCKMSLEVHLFGIKIFSLELG